jgi:hypothetical protein
MQGGGSRKSRRPMDLDVTSLSAFRLFLLGAFVSVASIVMGILQLIDNEGGRISAAVLLSAGLILPALFLQWVTRPVDWGPVDVQREAKTEEGIKSCFRWSPAVFFGFWVLGGSLMLITAEFAITGERVLEAVVLSLFGAVVLTGSYLLSVWASAEQLKRRRRARGEYTPGL